MNNSLTLKIENGFAVIEFDQPDSKVNVLSTENLTELEKLIQELNEKKDLLGLCIVSNKPDIFIAGADIKEIEGITTPSEAESKAKSGQEILNALERLPFPTLALINGACLGGGLELALACDYRLASFSDKVKLGLPEVKLGIIPGFGGTKRLPRLVGLRKGLELILSGEALSAEAALKIGLVDGLVSQRMLLEEGRELLKKKGEKRKQFSPKTKGFLNLFLERTFLGRAILKHQARDFVLQTTKGHYPAPLKALDVVVKNYSSSLNAALERESKAFSELAIGLICKNLISVFYLIEKYKKAKYGLEAEPRKLHKCGILGAGVMGGGIAQLFSSYGLAVRMKDLNYSALGRGLKEAREVYDYAVKKRKLKPHQAEFGMGLISVTCDYSGFSNADLIVEAVVEDMQLKQAVFAEVSAIAKPNAILASNTSCLSITRMAQEVKGKERVVGMHFFNPVHRMPLVEIIRTAQTSDESIATIVEFSRKIGKIPVVVKDSCGFMVNRILLPYLNEAGLLLEEGVSFEKIDRIMLKFGMPIGPFTLIDEIGLDVGYKVALILENHFGPRMKVAEILKKIYEKKWLGKKSGKGFYIHKGRERQPNKEVYSFISGRKTSSVSSEDILKRMLYRMINEAAMCLQEKVCSEASDVDIGMVMGTGFPPFKGGLLYYADSIGLDKIAEDLKRFQDQTGSVRFVPCNYLLNLAKRKEKFYQFADASL
ncbi:MAG: 3-hydroxyacyl-CoA dehydrogenase NAD-binding domain-containing protein [Candidatus Omnitrophota bacterium]|nr:3-hydroxyacyl-CoA dehydrogenase NAD-binding domain-containing protein [Candidatus Omnitrophota bacterium]